MSAAVLLDRLEAVRETSPGRWIARCPAHDDRHPSLSIRELPDSTVLLKCWTDCSAADIVAAVGLSLADLFPRRLSPEEEAEHGGRQVAIRRVREAETRRKAEAREKAVAIWRAARPASDDHPYLLAKGVKSHGLRVHDGALVVPVRDGAELHSLQFIVPDGVKRFLTGGHVGGCYYSIGGEPDDVLCIAEGYATGASIYEATGHAVAVAFNAGNLLPVARRLREKFSGLRLIVCADDDAHTTGNPGLTKAREAAQAVGGLLAVPEFGARRPEGATDFNDLSHHAGPQAVRACIERAVTVAEQPSEPVPAAILTRGDTIEPQPITWLWDGWLAAGKFHTLAGKPGTGKTTLALALGATVTCGGCWPDGSRSGIGDVVIWSGEDDAADALIPRLVAMGADRRRVHIVTGMPGKDGRRPFDPAYDILALSLAMEGVPEARLLIVDPIVSAVVGDSNKNAETRRSLQPLVDLAARHRCALIGITHLSKGTAGRDPVERVTGSLAFSALARVVMLAAQQQAEGEKPAQRLLMRAKSNIGPDGGGYAYDLRQVEVDSYPGLSASSVLWGDAIEGTARELLGQAEQEPDEHGTDAATFLRVLLAKGPQPSKEVFAEARSAGYSTDAMHRARRKIGAQTRKQGMSGAWMWSLPALEDGAHTVEGGEDSASQNVPPSPPSGDVVLPSDDPDGVTL